LVRAQERELFKKTLQQCKVFFVYTLPKFSKK
jgi:hypothetical protein